MKTGLKREDPNWSRRDFITATAAVTAAVSLGAGLSPAMDAPPVQRRGQRSLLDRPMRWAQLALVENDPGNYDLDFWLNYFKRTHSDAVCLSAGGCVAFYPTKIPFHYRSPWMGKTDPFGDLVSGCRKLGMVILARTDPHATYDDVQAAHPDWIAVDAEGKPRRHWASPEMWVTCALGPYNFQFMTEVHKEIMARYRVDGIFINRWDGSGMCYCQHCQKDFQTATGFDLPRNQNPQDPAKRAHILWRQEKLFALWRLWDEEILKINPDARVIPNTGGGATSSLDMKKIGELADTLIADRQARRGLMPLWANGKNGKEFRAVMGQKPVVGIFSIGLEEPYRWKDSVQSEAEIRLWVAEGIANDLRPWFTKFGAVLQDERWLPTVEKIYQRHRRWERYLRNESSLASVALVYSQQTAWFHGGEREKLEDHTLGWYQALIEARMPFAMVHDGLLDADHIHRFRTLILPNIAALSTKQCEQLEAFVAAGGNLVATYETSLYDEWGVKRKDFGLADLFGVSFKSGPQGPRHNSYLRLEHETAGGHPLLRGLEDTRRIIHGVWRLDVEARASFPNPPLTLVPSYPDLPMEKVYPREGRTEQPEVYLRSTPRGRVAYFPWDVDRTFWEVMAADHGKLLRNAVAWATNEEMAVSVTGSGVLDVTAWRQETSITVHLVNLTNAMMMKGPVRELMAVGEQKVRIRMPDGAKPKKTRLLAAEKAPRTRYDGKHLHVIVPSVLDHEVVAIDL